VTSEGVGIPEGEASRGKCPHSTYPISTFRFVYRPVVYIPFAAARKFE